MNLLLVYAIIHMTVGGWILGREWDDMFGTITSPKDSKKDSENIMSLMAILVLGMELNILVWSLDHLREFFRKRRKSEVKVKDPVIWHEYQEGHWHN